MAKDVGKASGALYPKIMAGWGKWPDSSLGEGRGDELVQIILQLRIKP